MLKVIALLAVAVMAFLAYAVGFHESRLADLEAEAIVSHWDRDLHGGRPVSLLSEYAPLPEYERRLVTYYCTEVYERQKHLTGTSETLPYEYRTGCQSLIAGGWFPGWTITDGIDFLEDPAGYRR